MPIRYKDLKGPKGYPLVGNIPQVDLPNIHNQIENWTKEFGGKFALKLGPTKMLVATDPKFIQQVCQQRPHLFKRSQKLNNVLKEGGVDGVFNAEGDDWQRHRTVVAKGLDVRHQQKYYPSLVQVTERLFNKWKQYADSGEAFDLQKELLRYTVDVTTLLAFGYDVNTIEQKGGVIQEHMEVIFPTIFKRINDPIPWHKIIPSKNDKKFKVAISEMNKMVDELIANARVRLNDNPKLKEEPENLIQSILVEADLLGNFTDDEVRGNLLTLLMAGEDTTAHTLNWMIFQLFDHPEIVNNIRTVLDEQLGEDNWVVNYKTNASLKYIEGVMNESLRHKPIAPILLHQAIEDVIIDDFLVEKGQVILTQARAGYLSNENFSEADKMIPERWMRASKCPVHNVEAFTPFGSGPRYCPGRNLAILEVKAVISMLFKNFDIELITPKKDVQEIMAFVMVSNPYLVRLKHRKNS